MGLINHQKEKRMNYLAWCVSFSHQRRPLCLVRTHIDMSDTALLVTGGQMCVCRNEVIGKGISPLPPLVHAVSAAEKQEPKMAYTAVVGCQSSLRKGGGGEREGGEEKEEGEEKGRGRGEGEREGEKRGGGRKRGGGEREGEKKGRGAEREGKKRGGGIEGETKKGRRKGGEEEKGREGGREEEKEEVGDRKEGKRKGELKR